MAITIPNDYGYVLLTLTGTAVLNLYHSLVTGGARREAKVPYPNAYATKSEADADLAKFRFNCAQRAHANLIESLPTFVICTAIAGMKYPVVTAGMGAVWLLGRFLYVRGYARSTQADGGKGRYQGIFFIVPQLLLMGISGWTGWQLVQGL